MTPPEAAVKAEIVPLGGLTNQPGRRSNGGDGHRGVTHRNVASGVGFSGRGEKERDRKQDKKGKTTGTLEKSQR